MTCDYGIILAEITSVLFDSTRNMRINLHEVTPLLIDKESITCDTKKWRHKDAITKITFTATY